MMDSQENALIQGTPEEEKKVEETAQEVKQEAPAEAVEKIEAAVETIEETAAPAQAEAVAQDAYYFLRSICGYICSGLACNDKDNKPGKGTYDCSKAAFKGRA